MITGQAKSTSIDVNGNLIVSVEYTLTDGSKISEGLHYSCFNFTKELLLKDIKQHCEALMYKIYNTKQNQVLANIDISDVNYQCSSVEFIVNRGKDITETPITITINDTDNQILAQEAVIQAKGIVK